ncbi:MAG: hypothetical protein ACOZAO_04735 [Patescibacteria group bacterium]
MKNNLFVIFGGLTLLIITGLFIYSNYLDRKASKEQAQNRIEETSQNPEEESLSSISGSIADLLQRGTALTCTYDSTTEAGNTSGIVYIDDSKLRADFTTKSNDEVEISSSMLLKEQQVYAWSDSEVFGGKNGVTFKVNEENSDFDFNMEEYENTNLLDFQQAFDWDCKPGIVKASAFELPEGIEFMEIDQGLLMEQEILKNLEDEDLAEICSACDNAPTQAAIEQCKQTLGC